MFCIKIELTSLAIFIKCLILQFTVYLSELNVPIVRFQRKINTLSKW